MINLKSLIREFKMIRIQKNCFILNSKSISNFSRINTEFKFKAESVMGRSSHGHNDFNVLGYELLLDFKLAEKKHGKNITKLFKNSIDDGYVLHYLIDRLLNNWLDFESKISKIFINMERHNLCNVPLLRNIVLASNYFFLEKDLELVIEITERDFCGKCPLIADGLLYLKMNKVSLAVDDYDIYSYNQEYRYAELKSGLYDYIKINVPVSPIEKMAFNQFAKNNINIILERVESILMLNDLNLNAVIGYQGYMFSEHNAKIKF